MVKGASNPLSESLGPSPAEEVAQLHFNVCESQRGDSEARRVLYDLFRNRVYRLALRMVGPDNVDDATQQIWLQLFRSLSQFKGASSFQTWMYRLAINECLQFRRKAARRPCVFLEADPVDDKPSIQHDSDDRELLQQAMDRLEPELRAVFLLREVEHLSYADIADSLQVAEGTVASRLNRARLELRRHLTTLGWEGTP